MSRLALRDGFSFARSQARDRIENAIDLKQLFRVIDADPAIVGAGVVYIDSDFNVVTLRAFQPICSVAVKRVILREAPRYMGPQEFVRELGANPRESQVVMEVVNAGLACLGAVIAWHVVLSGSIAIPFTAGASAVIAGIALTAAVAGSMQCLNGVVRIGLEHRHPEVKDNFDSNDWYAAVVALLDSLTLLGAASTTLVTVRYVSAIRASTGKSVSDVLRGLTRQERGKLTAELLMLRDPSLTPKLLKLKQAVGNMPKRYSQVQINHALITQIKDMFGAGLAITGSSMSGNLNAIAVGVYQESNQ